jgi:FlgN protein
MADNDNNELIETTNKEKAEFETMRAILLRKRDAIARLDTEAIRNAVTEELDELKRIKSAEDERARVLKKLQLSGLDLDDPGSLMEKLGRIGEPYSKAHSDFKKIFAEVQHLNGMINVLLVHSVAFIKQNIRILTDNGNRKLVDKKA